MSASLDSIDGQCLKLLEQGPLHASAIAQKIKLNRTTIRYRLKKLEARGVIHTTGKGAKNATLWHIRTRRPSNGYVQIFQGASFHRAFEVLRHLEPHSIMLGIQGARHMTAWPHVVDIDKLKKVHALQKRRHIIAKVLLHADGLSHAVRDLPTSLIESHLDRSIIANIFTDQHLFRGDGEIIALPKFFILTHARKRFAMVVKEPVVVHLMYEILTLIFELLEKHESVRMLDFNAYLRDILKARIAHDTQT